MTSHEHWLGNENAQLVDDIAKCMADLETITASNYKLVNKEDGSFRYVNYLISRLKFDKNTDEILEVKRKKTKHLSRKTSVDIGDNGDKSAPAGILLILEEVTSKEYMLQTLSKQVPASIINNIRGDGNLLEGAVQRATVLNIDIRGFTKLQEEMSPARIVQYLNYFHEAVFAAVIERGGKGNYLNTGIVTQTNGDSATVVFGIPYSDIDTSSHAITSAVKLQGSMEETNLALQGSSLPAMSIGIGISTGMVTSGAIGPKHLLQYTAFGRNNCILC